MTSEEPVMTEVDSEELVEEKRSSKEEIMRWLTIAATVALIVFLIYLLLILIYPSLNIGMSP